MAYRLTLERRRKGLSQAQLGRLANVHPTSISRIEAGIEPPFPQRSQRIADALGWTEPASKLFEEVHDE